MVAHAYKNMFLSKSVEKFDCVRSAQRGGQINNLYATVSRRASMLVILFQLSLLTFKIFLNGRSVMGFMTHELSPGLHPSRKEGRIELYNFD